MGGERGPGGAGGALGSTPLCVGGRVALASHRTREPHQKQRSGARHAHDCPSVCTWGGRGPPPHRTSVMARLPCALHRMCPGLQIFPQDHPGKSPPSAATRVCRIVHKPNNGNFVSVSTRGGHDLCVPSTLSQQHWASSSVSRQLCESCRHLGHATAASKFGLVMHIFDSSAATCPVLAAPSTAAPRAKIFLGSPRTSAP